MKHFLDVVMQFIFEVFLALTCPKFGSTGRVVFFLIFFYNPILNWFQWIVLFIYKRWITNKTQKS